MILKKIFYFQHILFYLKFPVYLKYFSCSEYKVLNKSFGPASSLTCNCDIEWTSHIDIRWYIADDSGTLIHLIF